MATIGTFKKVGNGYNGEIVTLSLQTPNVRIAPETTRANDNAPMLPMHVVRCACASGRILRKYFQARRGAVQHVQTVSALGFIILVANTS